MVFAWHSYVLAHQLWPLGPVDGEQCLRHQALPHTPTASHQTDLVARVAEKDKTSIATDPCKYRTVVIKTTLNGITQGQCGVGNV